MYWWICVSSDDFFFLENFLLLFEIDQIFFYCLAVAIILCGTPFYYATYISFFCFTEIGIHTLILFLGNIQTYEPFRIKMSIWSYSIWFFLIYRKINHFSRKFDCCTIELYVNLLGLRCLSSDSKYIKIVYMLHQP